jgi:hypothetical protein
MVSQKSQFGAQALHLFEQIEHGFQQGQIGAVHGPHVLDSPNGMDRLFRECHDPIGRLKDGSHKTGTTIDQNGTTGDTCEMGGRIEAVQYVWPRLKQLQGKKRGAVRF